MGFYIFELFEANQNQETTKAQTAAAWVREGLLSQDWLIDRHPSYFGIKVVIMSIELNLRSNGAQGMHQQIVMRVDAEIVYSAYSSIEVLGHA